MNETKTTEKKETTNSTLSFGGIKPKGAGTTRKRKEYPMAPDNDGTLAKQVDFVIEVSPQVTPLKLCKSQIGAAVTEPYFEHNEGRSEPVSTMKATGTKGTLNVSFANRYSLVDDPTEVQKVMGARFADYMKQTFKLEIDGDQVPAHHAQALIGELQALFAKYSCMDALSVKAGFKPVPTFHDRRHLDFDKKANLLIQAAMPTQIRVAVAK